MGLAAMGNGITPRWYGAGTYASYSFALPFKDGGPYISRGLPYADITTMPGFSYVRAGVTKYEVSYSGSAALPFAPNVVPIVANVGYWARSQTTNMALYSGDWSNAAYGAASGLAATVTGNAGADPFGGNAATRVTFAAQYQNRQQAFTAVAGNPYTVSFWAKAETGNTALHLMLESGTIFFPITVTPQWQRFSKTFTPAGTVTSAGIQDRNTSGFGGVLVTGLQIETGSVMGAYIPTTSAAVTIDQDDMRFTTPIPIDEDQVIYVVANVQFPVAANFLSFKSPDNQNRIVLFEQTGGNLSVLINASNVTVYTQGAGIAGQAGRIVVGVVRRGGNWMLFAKYPTGQMVFGAETAGAFPVGLNEIFIGTSNGQSATTASAPVEFVGMKKGTFTNGDLTALMIAATTSPKSILGADLLEAWEASRYDLITQSGGVVSAWAGSVMGTTVTQSFASQKFAYSATGFNGKPILTADGVDDMMEVSPNPFSPTDPMEVWAVVDQQQLASDVTARRVMAMGDTATATRVLLSSADGTNLFFLAGANNISSTRSGFAGRHVVRAIVDTDGVTAAMDGILSGKLPVNTTASSARLRIGASAAATAAGFFKGGYHAVLVTRPLSSAKAAALLAYYNEGGL
jgi:hypothetical protein